MGDCRGALQFLRKLPSSNGKVGVIGTCSGGRHAFLAACQDLGFDAAVDCWGGRVVAGPDALSEQQPVAPIDLTRDLGCPLLGIFGNDDQFPPPQEVDRHEQELKNTARITNFIAMTTLATVFYYHTESYRPKQAMDAWEKPDLYGQTSEIMPDPFVNMIKPVGSQCNLTCFYCYYLGTDKSLEQEPTGRMPDDLLEKAIVQTIKASPGPVVSFVWHGGEPTLAGLDFYRMAVSIQKANLPSGWSCWNSLQTNGVLLDDAWCDFLAESGFSVGISLDGSAEIHDAVRRDRVGKGTYQRVVAAVRRLQERGIQPDLLCTVTGRSPNSRSKFTALYAIWKPVGCNLYRSSGRIGKAD